MTLYLASDHRGFQLKEVIKSFFETSLLHNPVTLVDCGPTIYDPTDDYVDFGTHAISQMTQSDQAILLCGSGHGMDILANRHPKIRAVLGFNDSVVKQGREDENANVLILPADWISETQALAFVKIFLTTPFSNAPRHLRRLEKINKLVIS